MDYRIVRAVAEDGIASHIKDVFLACYEEIITRRITTIAALREYLEELPWHPGLDKVVRKSARLIRELNWGMFRDLDKETFPRLWKVFVLPDRHYRDIGDLKRNINVPNVFCSIIDIHAYTEFCRRHRHNFSMLNVLDGIIEQDVRDIARRNECMSYRTGGDNIVVIGTSGIDVLNATLGILDCFSRRRVVNSTKLAEARRGKSIVLQDIQVTAGIAGGQHYSSMIVTTNGDVSGSIVNTASRLQGFANFLSPENSRVMITSHVHSAVHRDSRSKGDESLGYEFFFCGRVHFKGVGLPVYEVLSMESDFKKLRYQKELRRLQTTINNGSWKDRILPDTIGLVIAVLNTVPFKKLEVVFDEETKVYSTSTVISFAEHALETYRTENDHRHMSDRLGTLLKIIQVVRRFDRLALIHVREVAAMFDRLAREYEAVQYEKIRENENGLFSQKERKVLANADRFDRARDRLIERGKDTNNIYSSSMLWNKVISEAEKEWEFRIYSGKR